ncbi:MAG TPA: glycogen-binding domain-containing protein [Longimicrobiales bacterium]|nr:glycogen-binding domain-containing protein [Longimicrobiales bacterium]
MLALSACAALAASPVHGQARQWTVDVYAGGTRYGGLSALSDALGVVANLRLATPRFSAFASAAAPLNGDSPTWTALGADARPTTTFGMLEVGASLAADGFLFRQFQATGAGASVHVLPLVGITRGGWSVELHGGRRDYGLTRDEGTLTRHIYELGAEVMHVSGPFTPAARLKSVTVPEGDTHHFAGVELSAGSGAFHGWGSAGLWFVDGTESEWSLGAAYDAGARGQVWAAVQRSALDPLYLAPPRTTWNVGYSIALGRSSGTTSVAAPEVRNGMLLIRLTRETPGPVFVAGEFSDWTLVPMSQAGGAWELAVPVTPGATRFSFVDGAGEWFVPEGYPGRISDNMGGHVVLVVVP